MIFRLLNLNLSNYPNRLNLAIKMKAKSLFWLSEAVKGRNNDLGK